MLSSDAGNHVPFLKPVTLICRPPVTWPEKFIFYKDGVRVKSGKDNYLRIERFTENDAGIYFCDVEYAHFKAAVGYFTNFVTLTLGKLISHIL